MEWRGIKEVDYRYEVSGDGQVRESETKELRNQYIINSGYMKVAFYHRGKNIHRLVHRLVASEFCEGFEEGLVVNHINGNKLDNRKENLEWVTQKENIHDSINRGTFNVETAQKIAWKVRKRKVIQRDLDGNIVGRYDSARQAAEAVGIHENNISKTCRGGQKTSMGFLWEYDD